MDDVHKSPSLLQEMGERRRSMALCVIETDNEQDFSKIARERLGMPPDTRPRRDAAQILSRLFGTTPLGELK